MSNERITNDVKRLIDDMNFSEKDARADYRIEEANTTRYYADKLKLILAINTENPRSTDMEEPAE